MTGYVGLIRDITEQVEAQEKYRLFAETSSDLIMVLENETMAYVIPSVREVLGYGPEELTSLLAEQIGGTLELQKRPSPAFTIRFPLE